MEAWQPTRYTIAHMYNYLNAAGYNVAKCLWAILHYNTLFIFFYIGKGVYRWADGSYYEGMWFKGDPHGFGEHHGSPSHKQPTIYKGEWKKGSRHGAGM